MASALPLGAALRRGALVTLANWPVVLVDFTIESVYKLALGVPIVGGALMVAVLFGADLRDLLAEGAGGAADLVLGSLLAAPVAFGSFVAAVGLVGLLGAIVMHTVKIGTLAVLVSGERGAPAVQAAPWRREWFARASAWELDRFRAGMRRFGRRAALLVVLLAGAYVIVAAGYLGVLLLIRRLASPASWALGWPLLVVLASCGTVVAVAAANLVYDLLRLIVAGDDCAVTDAVRRLAGFLAADARQVAGIFGVMTGLQILAFAVSLLAAAGLALVAWVPIVGLVVIPLQAAAWLVRGLVFQYLSLTALAAYQSQYRQLVEPGTWAGAPAAGGGFR